MAQPTWQQLTAPDLTDSIDIITKANKGLVSGLGNLVDVAKTYDNQQKAQYNNDILNQLSKVNNNSNSLESIANNIDPTQVNDIVANLIRAKRQNLYDTNQQAQQTQNILTSDNPFDVTKSILNSGETVSPTQFNLATEKQNQILAKQKQDKESNDAKLLAFAQMTGNVDPNVFQTTKYINKAGELGKTFEDNRKNNIITAATQPLDRNKTPFQNSFDPQSPIDWQNIRNDQILNNGHFIKESGGNSAAISPSGSFVGTYQQGAQNIGDLLKRPIDDPELTKQIQTIVQPNSKGEYSFTKDGRELLRNNPDLQDKIFAIKSQRDLQEALSYPEISQFRNEALPDGSILTDRALIAAINRHGVRGVRDWIKSGLNPNVSKDGNLVPVQKTIADINSVEQTVGSSQQIKQIQTAYAIQSGALNALNPATTPDLEQRKADLSKDYGNSLTNAYIQQGVNGLITREEFAKKLIEAFPGDAVRIEKGLEQFDKLNPTYNLAATANDPILLGNLPEPLLNSLNSSKNTINTVNAAYNKNTDIGFYKAFNAEDSNKYNIIENNDVTAAKVVSDTIGNDNLDQNDAEAGIKDVRNILIANGIVPSQMPLAKDIAKAMVLAYQNASIGSYIGDIIDPFGQYKSARYPEKAAAILLKNATVNGDIELVSKIGTLDTQKEKITKLSEQNAKLANIISKKRANKIPFSKELKEFNDNVKKIDNLGILFQANILKTSLPVPQNKQTQSFNPSTQLQTNSFQLKIPTNINTDIVRKSKTPTDNIVNKSDNIIQQLKIPNNNNSYQLKVPNNNTYELKVPTNNSYQFKIPTNTVTNQLKIPTNTTQQLKIPTNTKNQLKIPTNNTTQQLRIPVDVVNQLKIPNNESYQLKIPVDDIVQQLKIPNSSYQLKVPKTINKVTVKIPK